VVFDVLALLEHLLAGINEHVRAAQLIMVGVISFVSPLLVVRAFIVCVMATIVWIMGRSVKPVVQSHICSLQMTQTFNE
jgi:hypothetical protein